jgi:hypothetical protein
MTQLAMFPKRLNHLFMIFTGLGRMPVSFPAALA